MTRGPKNFLRATALAGAIAGSLLLQPVPSHAGGNIEGVVGGQIINLFWDARMMPIDWRIGVGGGFTFFELRDNTLPAMDSWENLPDNILDFNQAGATGDTTPGFDFNPPLETSNNLHFNDSTLTGSDGFVAAAPCISLTANQTVVDSSDGNPSNGIGWLRLGAQNARLVPIGVYGPGTNVDCDVRFNNAQFTFTIDNTPATEDIQGITTHEIGHWHSLSHTPLPDATMFPFTDTNPPGDGVFPGGGSASLDTEDIASTFHIYDDSGVANTLATITGTVTIDGSAGTAVHVTALRTSDCKPVAARFTLTQFHSTTDPVDGADAAANGGGYFRLDGLPPGDYYVCVEFFDSTDERIGARLQNNYNTSVANSTVADGGAPYNGTLGFRPERTECYNTLESGDGGDGSTAGLAGVDDPFEAAVVSLSAGQVMPGVNIDINLRSTPGSAAARSDATGIGRHDLGPVSALTLVTIDNDGNNDDYWLLKFDAASLPALPYNVLEMIWTKFGRKDDAYIGGLLMADAGTTALEPAIVWNAKRLVTGWGNGEVGITELHEVRDLYNVTINSSKDLYFLIKQPERPAGAGASTVEAYFAIAHNAGAGLASGNSIFTPDNFANFFTSTTFDVVSRVRTETAPPVMITGASQSGGTGAANELVQGENGIVVTVTGAGFKSGATVELLAPAFGPPIASDITINNVTFVNSTTLTVDLDVGAFAPVGPIDVVVTNPELIVPNRGRVLTMVAGPDADSDGFIDSIDCAVNDANNWAIPGEIADSVVATTLGSCSVSATPCTSDNYCPGGEVCNNASTVRFDWAPSAVPGGTQDRYSIVRGLGSTLNSSGGSDYGTCLADNLLLLNRTDADDPGNNEVFIYNFNEDNICGDGSYGTAPRDANAGNC